MDKAFQIVVLGCTGGPKDGNLSGYLLSPLDEQQWIGLDAGSLLSGIEIALQKGSLRDVPFADPIYGPGGEMLIKHIKGFLLSHAHLDHISGLVLNSQMNMQKFILGTYETINHLRDHIFNGKIWPNYGNEGAEPALNYFDYVRVNLEEKKSIPQTTMSVEAFQLSHPHAYHSTAFLIEYQGKYMLYFGDTSSDYLESEKHLEVIWKRIAPLIRNKSFYGMLLECSFSHADAPNVIYGHLDTKLMMREMHHLQEIARTPLKGLKVIVTHRKESLKKDTDALKIIEEELTQFNDLNIDFIFPTQGDRIIL